MSKRDEFFLTLGKAGATQRQAQNIFYAFDFVVQQDNGMSENVLKYQHIDNILSPYGLKLSEFSPNAKVLPK
jgi:hypothetical protein